MRYSPKITAIAIMAACFAVPANAVTATYTADLSGAAEAPPNASPGTGSALVTIDTTVNTLRVEIDFADLLAGTTAAHIHGPTADPFTGTAGIITTTPSFPGFPSGVTSGSYDQTFDLTDAGTFRAGFISEQGGLSQAATALVMALDEGRAYLNIHTEMFPAGEIRGFLAPIPLPAALPLLIGGLLMLAGLARFRRTA